MSVLRPNRPHPRGALLRSEAGWHAVNALQPKPPSLGQRLREVLRPPVRLLRRSWRALSGRTAQSERDRLLLMCDDIATGLRLLMQDRATGWAPPAELALPHLVWVSSWQTRCGIAEYSRHLLKAVQAQHGWHITVLHDDRPALPQIVPCKGIRAQAAFTAGETISVGRLAQAVAAAAADCVVIQHNPGLMPWAMLADVLLHPALAGLRVVVVLHNTADLLHLGRRLQSRLQSALRTADRVLVHTSRDIGLLNSFGLSNIKGLAQGCPAGVVGASPRKLPPQVAPVIGCTGFLMPHKGVQALIRAAAPLRATWPGLRLRLVTARYPGRASAAELAACQALARRLGLAEHIEWHTEFLPEAEQMALLRGCDLLVLPYLRTSESSSAAARLAVASGAPVMVSNLPIFDDLGDAVARFSETTPGGLGGQIADFLHAPHRRAQLQAQANAWRAEHDWAVIAGQLGSLLDTQPQAR